jgi:hypothetical protein
LRRRGARGGLHLINEGVLLNQVGVVIEEEGG